MKSDALYARVFDDEVDASAIELLFQAAIQP